MISKIEISTQHHPSLSRYDVANYIGVKSDGSEANLGWGPISPQSKAKEILRSYGYEHFSNNDHQDVNALYAMEDLIRWMVNVGWKAPEITLDPQK